MPDNQTTKPVKVIGFVRNDVNQPQSRGHEWQQVISDIVIDKSLTQALDDLDENSHITVLFWLHQVDSTTPLPLKIHPWGNIERPLRGVFATRTQYRPNPIGVTTVKLLHRKGNILRVQGLDAINGSPVLDIKPYRPHHDTMTDARVPSCTDP